MRGQLDIYKIIVVGICVSMVGLTTEIGVIEPVLIHGLATTRETLSEIPVVDWKRTYGGIGYDGCSSALQTIDGGFLATGVTTSFGTEEGDMWLVKTDPEGNTQWNRTYGGADLEEASAILQLVDGNLVLVGGTYSFGAGESDMWLIKTDANGVAQWNKTYGGTGDDSATSLLQTTDGGFLLVGYSQSYGERRADIWLVKIHEDGTIQWNQTYGGLENEYVSSALQTVDGEFLLVGRTRSYGAGKEDIWVIKTTLTGAMLWNQTYGGYEYDKAYCVFQTDDKGFLLAGSTWVDDEKEEDMWLIKTDKNGDIQWNRTFGGTERDYAVAVSQTPDSEFLLVGSTYSYGAGESDIWVVKTNATGFTQWNQTYGGTGDEKATCLLPTIDKAFLIVGVTESYGHGDMDMWLIKMRITITTSWSPIKSPTITSTIYGIITLLGVIGIILVITQRKN